eukprot:Nk52_evm2s411 gene=Nk52_evmTU2s411
MDISDLSSVSTFIDDDVENISLGSEISRNYSVKEKPSGYVPSAIREDEVQTHTGGDGEVKSGGEGAAVKRSGDNAGPGVNGSGGGESTAVEAFVSSSQEGSIEKLDNEEVKSFDGTDDNMPWGDDLASGRTGNEKESVCDSKELGNEWSSVTNDDPSGEVKLQQVGRDSFGYVGRESSKESFGKEESASVGETGDSFLPVAGASMNSLEKEAEGANQSFVSVASSSIKNVVEEINEEAGFSSGNENLEVKEQTSSKIKLLSNSTEGGYEAFGSGDKEYDSSAKNKIDMRTPSEILGSFKDDKEKILAMNSEKKLRHLVKKLALTKLNYGKTHWRVAKVHVEISFLYFQERSLFTQGLTHAKQAFAVVQDLGEHASISGPTRKFMEVRHDEREGGEVADLLFFANMFYCLGVCYTHKNKLVEAEKYLKNSEKFFNKVKKRCTESEGRKVDGEPVDCYFNYYRIVLAQARLCMQRGETKKPQEYLEEISAMIQSGIILKDNNSRSKAEEIVTLYEQMGDSSYEINQSNEAFSMYSRAFEICTKEFAPGPPQLESRASTETDIPEILENETVEEPKKYYLNYLRATHIAEKVAALKIEMGQEKEAEKYIKFIIKHHKSQYGERDERTLSIQNEYLKMLVRNEKHNKAIKLLKPIIEGSRDLYGDSSPQMGDNLKLLASIRLAQGHTKDALKIFNKVKIIYSSNYGPHHRQTVLVMQTIDMLAKTCEKPPRFRNVVHVDHELK